MSIAAYNGLADAVKMLIEAGANTKPAGMPPLIAALNNENREIMTLLLDGALARDVLGVFYDKPFVVHAIKSESNLLPMIVGRARLEIEKMKSEGITDIPDFPPRNLKRRQRRAFKRAVKLDESTSATEPVDLLVDMIKCPWKPVPEADGQ